MPVIMGRRARLPPIRVLEDKHHGPVLKRKRLAGPVARALAGNASARYAAARASCPVSSWISTAIFVSVDAYCLLWCAQNSSSRKLGSRTRT